MQIFSEDYICGLPAEVQKYASKVINETEENRKNGFQKIKTWAAEHPHLNIHTEDKYILPFLRSCKFDITKTKEKIKKYYTMKQNKPEWYTNRNPKLPEIQEVIKEGAILLLKESQNHKGVLMVRLIKKQTLNIDTLMKVGLMVGDLNMLQKELIQIYGCAVIIDMQNISFRYVNQITPMLIKNLLQATLNYPSRPQKIVMINVPNFISMILNVLLRCLPAKMKGRVTISTSGDITEIDRSILPSEYGGEGGTLEELANCQLKQLIDHSDWYEEDENYKFASVG